MGRTTGAGPGGDGRRAKYVTGVYCRDTDGSGLGIPIPIERADYVEPGEATGPADIFVTAETLSFYKELLRRIAAAVGAQPGGVNLPTAQGLAGEAVLRFVERHVPNDVRGSSMAPVETGVAALGRAGIEWISR